MRSDALTISSKNLNDKLTGGGFRFTAQREQVYASLVAGKDHPTAEEVFLRVKREKPEISMATIYNCLDALVKCGLIRQVNLERGATRYCANMDKHSHFHCDVCGGFFDIEPQGLKLVLPKGFNVIQVEVSLRGSCPKCSATESK